MSSCDRMTDDQVERLAMAICATAEILGHVISSEAAELMAEDLADYQAHAVAGALRACRRELTGRLTLAAILQRLQAADGRPAPDEAWAIALSADDESVTVVMTEEIGQALAAARPVLDAGDKIGGRKTFLAAYERLVATSRQSSQPARWSVSLGTDRAGRLIAIEEAVRLGRLPAPEAEALAAPLRLEMTAPTAAGLMIAGLIGCDPESAPLPDDENRARWQELRKSIRKTAPRVSAAAVDAADLERRKSEAAAALDQLKRQQEGKS